MKRSIVIEEHLDNQLVTCGLITVDDEDFSGAINEALARYFKICKRSRPVLSLGEWEAIKDALDYNHSGPGRLGDSIPFLDEPRQLPIVFEEYLVDFGSGVGLPVGDGSFLKLKVKYPYSGVALLEKLQKMTYAALVSVVQAVEAEEYFRRKCMDEVTRQPELWKGRDDAFRDALGKAHEPKWVEAIGWDYCEVEPMLEPESGQSE